ncbi:hypothetical protein SMACR_02490 [Sordaria macrospora]|uniref:WGS project CABT00000000 data, contig 2.3 n=2 Tax=Sordaria macrospora TaxID=5147 RepID=F7VPQ9_SORMK|nr:uncharacterized protein SMAC_02490 [Sordaria macrospora k-hell]KAA8629743.1 hypothetical protein SMACR_02490 [Sordaria macrospora]WPJ64879.1 hypothetical protein SMAC4_02490 [Sordaria macrospora]CCC07487.1 unnamed protein product [Sordaria macrospora k-hell]
MSSATSTMIPRFLLPQYGRIWQRSTQNLIQHRLASTKSTSDANTSASGPRVLAKPERFNPPSHGSRLPNKKHVPRHYGGDLSFQEKQAQAKKEYPGLMPGEGTYGWWFWNNKWFHMCLTLGTLFSLAIYTATENFKRTSPFADMLPAKGDFLSHPIDSFQHLGHVIRLHEAHKSAEISAKRQRAIDDVAKRTMYRKAHGLPEEQGVMGFIKLKEPERIASVSRGVLEPEPATAPAPATKEGEQKQEQQQQ